MVYIIQVCDATWEAHKGDCSGFVNAVAAAVRVPLGGLADQIVNTIRGPNWGQIIGGLNAANAAANNYLVIAGLRGDEQFQSGGHGHVVVIVPGQLEQGLYPRAYWGKLGGVGKKKVGINWAWIDQDVKRVTFAAHAIV